jgi:Tfp pilus assembly protein PilF
MSVHSRPIKRSLVLALAMAASACASLPQRMQDAMHATAMAGSQQAQDRVHAAMELLDRGEEARARSLLESALRQEPGNATARRLLDEINLDPRRQLGERSYAYVVRDSDTMTSLAERFLGDPLMFYALARYNDIVPNQLAPGQTIRVPDRGRTTTSASAHASAPSATSAAPLAPSPTVSSDAVARANRLRLQGLERLNAGDADTAVALLRQARALDAANAAIQSDLNRAQRIQASLHTQ